MAATDEGLTFPLPRSDPAGTAPVPRAFVLVVFAVALVVAAAIAYYGFTGQLGAGVP
jgi:hypothetical protein